MEADNKAAVIRSLYRVKKHLPLQVRLHVLKSLIICHLMFSVFHKNYQQKTQRINQQTNRGF